MQVELPDEQWDALSSGRLEGPDGRRYQRRSTRMRRRQVDDLLSSGAPLVLYWYGGSQLDWCDGEDARRAWEAARSRLTTSVPRPDGDVVWTAGEWVSDDTSLVLLTGTC
ncbi:hypothetical protein WDZ17_14365 [Pseudokineococcus basanitobsidens]|uniref:Transposase n=1 Tax=Pseudokineococcus basanitobsidens TaxID=1926649 RepID=A0ABU8RN01_9ACTN